MLAESHDEEQIIARVAALDIGKAELVCCVRVPGPGSRTPAGGVDAFDDDPVVDRAGQPPGRTRGRAGGDGGDVGLRAT